MIQRKVPVQTNLAPAEMEVIKTIADARGESLAATLRRLVKLNDEYQATVEWLSEDEDEAYKAALDNKSRLF